MTIEQIILQAIDIHVHLGPEIIPRKYTLEKFINEEEKNLGGAVLKNHFYPTMPFIKMCQTKMQLFGGIVLNNAVGGLNPEAIYASVLLSKRPVMVWFPTINAEQFLENSTFEIAPEWVKQKTFVSRKADTIKPVIISKNGKLTKQVVQVLQAIKQYDCVLATGHISYQESQMLILKALQLGIKKVVVTHPIYQRIAMPLSIQKKLAVQGCFIEQSYSMYVIDDISIQEITSEIKAVGYQSVILSSDMGQKYSPSPSKGLYTFAKLLEREGISRDDLYTMLVINPKKLLGID